MSDEHQTGAADRIRRSYEAFNARDIDSALAAMHRDVDWPDAIDGGRLRGRDEIRQYWLRQFELFDPRVEPETINPDEHGLFVVDVHQVVRDLNGQVIADRRVQHVYTIRDGLITRMDIREPSTSEGSSSP